MTNIAIDWTVVATIAAPIVALIAGYLLDYYFGRKPKVVAYVGNVANFVIRGAPGKTADVPAYTHSLVLTNAGRETATDVRIGHYWMPEDYSIDPAIDHRVEDTPGSGKHIVIPKLVPKKVVTVSYLYFQPLTTDKIHSYLESDAGLAKVIPVILQRQFPLWFNYSVLGFCLIGIVATLYVLYTTIW